MSATHYRDLVKQAQATIRIDDQDRYIDFGVRFIVVAKDPDGTVPIGTELPAVRQIGEPHEIGGRYDTVTKRFIGPCHDWPVWMVGQEQFDILFNASKRHNLLYSAEGVGKTTLMSQWVWVQVILAAMSGTPGALGATGPTSVRLGTFIKGVCDLAPISTLHEPVSQAWGTLRLDAQEIQVCTGQHVIQFRSTKRQSEASGSPLQSFNFGLGIGMDELQDSLDAYPDAISRLRSSPTAPILGTATAKDSTDWRNFRDSLNDKYWEIHRLSYLSSPFVHDSHWEMMRENTSERDWMRRGLALDVGPERMVYQTWDRATNLRPVPIVGGIDVTEQVLSQYGANQRILVGHDPGNAADVSVLLKAYQLPKEPRHRWWVVGEVTTLRNTTESHIIALKRKLHEFGCNPDQDYGAPHIRTDPTTDPAILTQFRAARLSIRPANYKPGSNKAKTIPKESRIEMVCRLFRNATGYSGLFVAADDRGAPMAPRTVESIELSERDAAYEAETGRKGDQDISHWTTALGYALWTLERPRMADGGALGRVNS